MTKPQFDVAKGHRDYFGQEAILRNHIRDTLRTIFERYGYQPLETPLIEDAETLGFKGGGEIQKEVYRLSDQGKRKLALRFDQTVPLARFIACHPEIKFPFKRYAIGPVFRDGPTQPEQGRYRSFTQCDVDVLGIREMTAEAELFALAQDAFEALGLGTVEVKINNRKLLDGIMDYARVPDHAKLRTIMTLDKMDKLGIEGVTEALTMLTLSDQEMSLSNECLQQLYYEFTQSGPTAVEQFRSQINAEVGLSGYQAITSAMAEFKTDPQAVFDFLSSFKTKGEILLTPDNVNSLFGLLQSEGSNQKIFAQLEKAVTSPKGRQGLEEIRQLLFYGEKMHMDALRLDPSLARGLDYYTGTTMEVYCQDRTIVNSAILAGGRFDNMVGDFRGGEEIPAVGFSFGLERLVMILKQQNKSPQTTTQLYLIPMGTTSECLELAHRLRRDGINVDMEMVETKLGRSIGYASGLGIPYVGILGPDELQEGVINIKNLKTRQQEAVLLNTVSSYMTRQLFSS